MSSAVEESKEQLTMHNTLSSPTHGAQHLPNVNPSAVSASSSSAAPPLPSDVQLRPSYANLFKPRAVESMIRAYVEEYLSARQYDPNETSNWAKELAANIKNKLKELKLARYKYLVQVIIGENKGAGVRCGARCFWDQTTDKIAQTHYTNDTMFCVVAAFGVYLY